MKYKVGQKVRIKNLDWYNLHKRPLTEAVDLINGPNFVKEMSCFCNKIMTIVAIEENVYLMEEDDSRFDWTDDMIDGVEETKQEFFEKVSNAIKNYYKERPCRDCGPGNGCDDCRGCEDGKRDWEMWNEVKKLKEFYEYKFHTNYDEDKKVFENKNKPKFKPDDIVDTNDNLYGCVTDDITFDEVKNTFKYYVSFIVDGGYYYEYQLKPHIKSDEKGNEILTDKIILEKANTLKIQNDNMEIETHRGYYTTEETTNKSKKVAWFTFGDNDFADKVELYLSNRELIQEDGKWFVVKKKKEYPKNYEECCKVIGISRHDIEINLPQPYQQNMFNFFKLIICRNTYWKIAGEEMGLGKPWKPRWNDNYQKKWIINFYQNEINLTNSPNVHFILAFPTREMRDAFYENFTNEIEQSKELL